MTTYPDAPVSLIAQWEGRRDGLTFGPGEALPDINCDLAAMAADVVPRRLPRLPPDAGRHARKEYDLAPEFAGQSALLLLHGLTIAHLRKRAFPPHTPALFRRIWVEQAPVLLAGLSTRWLISAVITFGDHGATEAERALGREMNMMFSLMKLYEFERLHSGRAPHEVFRPANRSDAAMPLQMEPFSLVSGGLDVNLLAPLWVRAQATPVLGPVALQLFDRINADPGTIFARLQKMRARKARRQAQP